MKEKENYGFCLPQNKGYCVRWQDAKGNWHVVEDSYTKSKKKANDVSCDYMIENNVQTEVVECYY